MKVPDAPILRHDALHRAVGLHDPDIADVSLAALEIVVIFKANAGAVGRPEARGKCFPPQKYNFAESLDQNRQRAMRRLVIRGV